MQKTLELLGWVGVVFVIGAYILLSLETITPDSLTYQFGNLIGAIFLIGSSSVKRDFQPIALNSIWAFIALIGLVFTYI